MKISSWGRDEVNNVFIEMTEAEARRIYKYLEEQLSEDPPVKKWIERAFFEDVNEMPPKKTKGMFQLIVMRNEDEG